MSAHTPGPWHIGRSSDYGVFARDLRRICVAETTFGAEVAAANARLIAAAPELLAVLDRIIAAWDTGSDPDFTEFDIALREARRVSAAAHGRGIGAVLSEGSR